MFKWLKSLFSNNISEYQRGYEFAAGKLLQLGENGVIQLKNELDNTFIFEDFEWGVTDAITRYEFITKAYESR